jgi:hypothetical protein
MAGGLNFELLRFIQRVRRQPTDGSDPNLLDKLEKMALDDLEGCHVALSAPMANLTWESKVDLLKTDDESPNGLLSFTEPVTVLGFFPTVVPKILPVAGGSVAGTLDDLEVSVTVDKAERYTNSQVPQTVNAQEEAFVTASSLSTLNALRLIGINVSSPTPKFQFVWRWKQGKNIFVDSICCMAVIHRRIGASK